MTEPQRARLTYDDYRKIPWPENARYELLDGVLVMVAAPGWTHQQILGRLEQRIRNFLDDHDLGLVTGAPVDVRLGEDVVQPDLIFVPHENAEIVHEPFVLGAPALVVEVLSPSTRQRDRGYKLEAYARHGVREYWIVDPSARTVEVFRFPEGGLQPVDRLDSGRTLRTPLLDLEIPVSKIFARTPR